MLQPPRWWKLGGSPPLAKTNRFSSWPSPLATEHLITLSGVGTTVKAGRLANHCAGQLVLRHAAKPRRQCPARPTNRLFANDFYQYTLAAPAIKFAVKNLLPRSKIQLPAGNGHHHFAPHDGAFEVSVGIVFTGIIVAIA